MKSVAEMFPEEKSDSALVAEFSEQAKQIFLRARSRLTLQGKVMQGKYIAPLPGADPNEGSITQLIEFLERPSDFPDACLCSMSMCAFAGKELGIIGWTSACPRNSGGPIAFVICALDDTAKDEYRQNKQSLPDYFCEEKDIKKDINIAVYNDRADWNTLLYVWDRCGKENGWL